MSLVGPRPLLPEYLPLYSQQQARRHEVRPGITGLAQVSGRNQLDWESRFAQDVHYVDHVSAGLDLRILLKTLTAVLSRTGVSAEGHATMPTFTGTHPSQPADEGVAVFGAGGHAKVVIATLQASGRKVTAIYDDDEHCRGKTVLGIPVLGPLDQACKDGVRRAVLAIGDNAIRRQLAECFSFKWESVVHPSAVVHPSVHLGEGSVIFAGAIVQPDAQVGPHAIVNTAATVDHDCVVEACASIGPGAHLAGNVSIGQRAAIGTGACVIPGISIGEDTIVGAGTVVIADLPASVVAVGSPARIVRERLTWKAA
jgi:sugar O-acyltransferase (sialic acid O-acetyltransferase NeuD family)